MESTIVLRTITQARPRPLRRNAPHYAAFALALSRQIAEAHGGTVALVNREDRTGCRAELRLPRRSNGLGG